MGNSATRNENCNSQAKTKVEILNRSQEQHASLNNFHFLQRKNNKSSAAAGEEIFAEESAAAAAAAQRQRQTSFWNLGSLSGRLNWSFSGASKNSYRKRNKTSASLSAVQQRRLKTKWHKPLTNAIFSSHFKETSRNEQFHIEQLIAKGAFGVVFKVIDKQPQQLNSKNITNPRAVYALKVLKKSKLIDENSVRQIKEEADIQKLCGHHPFIVQQIDLWQNRHNLHILSEYVPNGELFSKIAHFSIDLVRLYLAEIAIAIDFLHNAGIIYRDAKPENILLTEKFHIKLTDFGLSKWLKLGATTRTMCGTFQYMAPEILRGEAYTHAVDWWSLGIIVCQMLVKKSPDIRLFATSSHILPLITTTNDAKIETTLESVNFLPAEVENLTHESQDVIKRLLDVDPKKRIRSVLALQKIAFYQNFKIESKYIQSISPVQIFANDNIPLLEQNHLTHSDAEMAFNNF